MFVRIGYVYPDADAGAPRPDEWLCAPSGVLMMLAIIWTLPEVPRLLLIASLFFPVYYIVLSLYLNARRGRRQ